MLRRCLSVLFVVSAACSSAAVAQPYTNLLSDSGLRHWMKPDGKDVDAGWILQPDGTLLLDGRGGNIITRQEYGDFELWFEFRIAEKGNSGIKYRVTRYGSSLLGCEYQILDDAAFPQLDRKNITASLYDVVPIKPAELRRNQTDQFDIGKVVVQNNRVRHWINGQLTIDECIGSARWHDYVAASKFADRENFGQNHFGHIMLTDHGSQVWYRNVFIRPLSPTRPAQTPLAQAAEENSPLAAK